MSSTLALETNPDGKVRPEAPQNGLAGLKHLRHDIVSGIVVSLVSLPLSSGIAIASGVPPIYGLISAIIAGLIFPFIGGSFQTIAGPAAGLAPALVAIMASLGGVGDATHVGEGYPFLLCIIFFVGIVQIFMSILKLARFSAIIPVSVVEGMLASIGLLIIVKQLPMFFGYTGSLKPHEFIEFVEAAPTYMAQMTVPVFAVSMLTFVLLMTLGNLKHIRLLQIVPPQLVAVVIGVILGQMFMLGDLNGGKFLISLPKDVLHGVHLPDFAALFTRTDLWYAAILGVITLTLIDGVESLATAMAIDRIDPFHRKSEPNRVLLAMGVCNIASSVFGGLTIIPGGVKSKANIASGGRTLWANFTNAICLILYLFVGRDLINMIPMGVLAAVLIYTGWKMCEPLVWKHMAHIGKEQLGIFVVTVVSTLMTDLLWGIIIGVSAKFLLNLKLYRQAVAVTQPNAAAPSVQQTVVDFFSNPVSKREMQEKAYHLYLDKPLVCFNSMRLSDEVDRIPDDVTEIYLHLDSQVAVIDHTSCENLMEVVQQFSHKNVSVQIVGLDRMRRVSEYHACTHLATPAMASA
jgi:MFS superfamily sulfate permease-like transporter